MKLLFRVFGAVLAGSLLALLAGCVQAPMLARPTVADLWPASQPQYYRAGVAVAAPAASASSAAVEAPRLIRGTDKVLGNASTPPLKQDGASVDLRFEDTPVREAVHAILGDLLKQDYVVYPPVDGRVTIATAAQVTPDTAVFMLEAALSANGLAMVRDARGVFHIGKAEALKAIAPAIRVAGRDPLPPGSGAIVVPLRHIGAAEMATILRPMVSNDAIARVDTVRNLLVLVGNRAQAEGWLGLVATFDIDLLAGMSVGVFPLKYASVADVETALQMMSAGGGRATAATGTTRPAGASPAQAAATALTEGHPLFGAIRVLPLERLNSVVVVTSRAAYLDEARRWIEKLDQPSNSSAEARLFVYPVRNGSARHLGEVLKGIYGGSGTTAAGTGSGVAPGLSSTTATTGASSGGGLAIGTAAGGAAAAGRSTPSTGVGQAAAQSVTSVQLGSNVRVVADELNNAILVYGSPAQFEKVEEALRKLDGPPTQVLIEASIIEVTLNDELNYGVQWLFNEDRGGGSTGTSVLSNLAGGTLGGALAGFSYTLRNSTGNVRTVLNALADKSLVKVISSPSLMVLDNHTAQIAVGNQTPIKLGETVSAEGGLRTTNIQYRDTGVSLSVTPSVGAGDMVTMNVNQSVTDIGGKDVLTGQVEFLQRQIGTKVAVRSGETIILGGLIRDNSSDGASGIPLLSEIPVLGALFGAKSRNAVRTELLVIITPRVARSDEDTREINRTIRERLRGMGTQPLARDSLTPQSTPGVQPVPDPSRPQ